MMEQIAFQDFERAYRRGFWRKIGAWLTGKKNQELLEYDAVRRELPFLGQRDTGIHEIPLDLIIGSVGRYRDFDRAFLPTQKTTSQRWINVDKARLYDVELPPIEVYKLGDVYFVKDGNHRVSVARERNQTDIDAWVTEVDVPIRLTPDMAIDDVVARRDYAHFLKDTNINRILPDVELELTFSAEYPRLINHIATHRYFLSATEGFEIAWEDAVRSWYATVYQPLTDAIEAHGLQQAFPHQSVTDLYLMVSEYGWLLQETNQGMDTLDSVTSNLRQVYSERQVNSALQTLQNASWIEQMLLDKDHANFIAVTQIEVLRPEADIVLSEPGKYENLLRHIYTHQYYLGMERQQEVSLEDAVTSFYDDVYQPLLGIIHEQGFIDKFPSRTEADLCLWVLDHRQDLVNAIETLPKTQ
jgi:hypothetical protein